MGLSIFYHDLEIESSVHNSIEGLVLHVIEILGGFRVNKNFENWMWKCSCCKTNCKNTYSKILFII